MNNLLTKAWSEIVAWRILLIPACVILLQMVIVQWLWPKPAALPTVRDVERLLSTAAIDLPPQPQPGPELPAFPLAECLACNPFGSLPAAVTESPATAAEPLNENSVLPFAEHETPADNAPDVEGATPRRAAALQIRVEAIYRTSRGAVALVDSQPVRAGDVLDGSFRITAIHLDGLVLERLVPASPPTGAGTLTEGPVQERR